MNGDWLFVIALVLLALAAGFVIGVARGRTVGTKNGREEAWNEYARSTGHAPPSPRRASTTPPAEAPSVESADFGTPPQYRGSVGDGDPW